MKTLSRKRSSWACGQRVGAFLLDRVLGGIDQEGGGQRQRAALDGHLLLLHRLQQGRLGLGRGAVDLVAQQQVAEDRTAADAELLGLQVKQGVAGDVARHQVRGELDAREAPINGRRQAARQERLAHPRHPFEQTMAGRRQGHHRLADHLALADQRPPDRALQGLQLCCGPRDGLLQSGFRFGHWPPLKVIIL